MGAGRNELGAEVRRELQKCFLKNRGMCFMRDDDIVELKYTHRQEHPFALYINGEFKQFVGSFSATVAAIEAA